MAEYPRTVLEFRDWFADEVACRDYLARLRWPKGFCCPVCRGPDHWVTERGRNPRRPAAISGLSLHCHSSCPPASRNLKWIKCWHFITARAVPMEFFSIHGGLTNFEFAGILGVLEGQLGRARPVRVIRGGVLWLIQQSKFRFIRQSAG